MSLLYPSTNQPTGDVIVTTSKEAVGIQYARSGDVLPSTLTIPLFQAGVAAGEMIGFDVQTFFSKSVAKVFFPADFIFNKILLNGQPFVAAAQTKSSNALVCATANVAALTGLTTVIDGVKLTVDGTIALLTGQTTGSENGLWAVHSGAWTRPANYATGMRFNGSWVGITSGALHAGELQRVADANPDVIDTNTSVWAPFTFAFIPSTLSFFFTSTETVSAAIFNGSLACT